VDDADAGVFTAPGDPGAMARAVEKLAKDPRAARRKGANGRQYIARYFARPALARQLTLLLEDMWRKNG
jgi:glycosyltransferase involved in cell wall biosynthesis